MKTCKSVDVPRNCWLFPVMSVISQCAVVFIRMPLFVYFGSCRVLSCWQHRKWHIVSSWSSKNITEKLHKKSSNLNSWFHKFLGLFLWKFMWLQMVTYQLGNCLCNVFVTEQWHEFGLWSCSKTSLMEAVWTSGHHQSFLSVNNRYITWNHVLETYHSLITKQFHNFEEVTC